MAQIFYFLCVYLLSNLLKDITKLDIALETSDVIGGKCLLQYDRTDIPL